MFNEIKKISTKLGLGFGFIVFIFLAAGFFSVIQYTSSMSRYKNYVMHRLDQLKSVSDLQNNFRDQVQSWEVMLLKWSNPDELKIFRLNLERLQAAVLKNISELKSSDHRFVSAENIKNLNEFESIYLALQNEYRDALNNALEGFDFKSSDSKIKGKDGAALKILDKIAEKSLTDTNVESEKLNRAIQNKGTFTVFILILALVLGVILAYLISQNITLPIIALNNSALSIAKGDLTQVVETQSNDEIGSLRNSFSLMVGNLNEILHKTTNAVSQITAASAEILSASQQQATGAREQSSAINETTSAALELSKSAELVGENIKNVAVVANHALAGMARIKEAITKTGEHVSSLNEKSQQIGKITELINDVADQTNLLAVNAAIEAARAGEEGRGFAVVADEIRKLADSTSKSTKDITALIEIIQHEMTNAIISMEQSVNNVNEESKLAQESADSAREIAMSANQQVSGSKQIATAMGNINDTMKQISSGAMQAQVSAKQLNALAAELNNLTEKFKLS